MKPNKQTYIDFILNELEGGNVQYKDVMLVFVSKFQLTEKTFCIYWKKANETYKQRVTERNIKIEHERTEIEKSIVKSNILNKHEALQILTDIARSEFEKAVDKKGAIETMSKIEGWNATTKTEIDLTTDFNLKDVISFK